MKVETTYNQGDEVWTMSNNKCIKTKTKIHYFEDGQYKRDSADNPETKIEDYFGWELEADEIPPSIFGHKLPIRRKETELFRTKEELIASL
jgi:hypothetical protein